MKIIIVGDTIHFEEARQKFYDKRCVFLPDRNRWTEAYRDGDVIFDFTIADEPSQFKMYASLPVTVFLNTCFITLASLRQDNSSTACRHFGFNGMPTLFNREYLEIAVPEEGSENELAEICSRLSTEFEIVEDRVGLVTARIVCMIINEAFYTVKEGTATQEDIDLAMKLGTNYPYGPFEWCKKMGAHNVYRQLQTLHDATKDARYAVAPGLREQR